MLDEQELAFSERMFLWGEAAGGPDVVPPPGAATSISPKLEK
jgi:hypothetical protein